MHPEINRSTLMDIIDQAGLTRDQFLKLLYTPVVFITTDWHNELNGINT